MKFLAFIMAFLVLALSVMPCADNGCFTEAKFELTKSDHQQNDQQQDDCSPFCTCTCCAGFSINHSIASITSLPLFLNNPASKFLSSKAIEVAFPIWQPPRSC